MHISLLVAPFYAHLCGTVRVAIHDVSWMLIVEVMVLNPLDPSSRNLTIPALPASGIQEPLSHYSYGKYGAQHGGPPGLVR